MNRRIALIIACGLGAWLCGPGFAAEVKFSRKGFQDQLTSFALTPQSPYSTDLIAFFDPYDGKDHSNSCVAEVDLGKPSIAVDEAARRVVISFTPSPIIACPAVVLPVRGIEGDFGPLPAGEWTFQTPLTAYSFTVVPEPALLCPAAGLMFLARRRRALGAREA